ncbi:MAG: hypothetical protein ACK4XJ_11975 [Fimbriimonadaceae bacterium]
MVAELNMKHVIAVMAAMAGMALVGCDSPQGGDLESQSPQPAADLEAGKNATTLEDWAKANPNNGAPGHGESDNK